MEIIKLSDLKEKNLPLKLLLLLAFSILICDLGIRYLYLFLPAQSLLLSPLVDSIILVIIISPLLYFFLYKPLTVQFDELKKVEVIQRELALIDELTGLYNRRGFLLYANHLLALSKRTKRGLMLIYADLDGLKQINDDFGHEGGDKAIMCVAKVLKDTFRGSDVIGRMGGDEYAILALDAKEESLDMLRNRLNENLKLSECNSNSKYELAVSLGIIFYNPEKPKTIEDLLTKADTLMYEEKNSKVDFKD
ncbi:MAG: GGDEF domain-containing protein [Candidatus Omnitrophica bacterium]|nr:GGDEF domain-containing protein [Candidatus Omnitrophota bacterium]